MSGSESVDEGRSLTDRAWMVVRSMILTNRLKPGESIDVERIIKEARMSRTPIRDALRRLAHEGLVEIRPRSGTFVAKPTPHDIEEVFELRKAVELHAIRSAVHRIPEEVLHHLNRTVEEAERRLERGNLQFFYDSDVEFHDTILRYANNHRLVQALQTAATWLAWFRVIGTKPNRPDRSLWYHRMILQALFARNPLLARDLLELHIDEVERDMLRDFGTGANG